VEYCDDGSLLLSNEEFDEDQVIGVVGFDISSKVYGFLLLLAMTDDDAAAAAAFSGCALRFSSGWAIQHLHIQQ
jgi:hypothetical protein